MNNFLRACLMRHERPVDAGSNLKAGIGAVLGMAIVGQIAFLTGLPLLIAPLGATAALLFGQPSSPLSQPVNIMAGYLVGTIVCEVAFRTFPGVWLAVALAVGVIIVVTRFVRVTHPPACAMPVLTFDNPVHGIELFAVVLTGCVVLICIAIVIHRLPPRRQYPLPPDQNVEH